MGVPGIGGEGSGWRRRDRNTYIYPLLTDFQLLKDLLTHLPTHKEASMAKDRTPRTLIQLEGRHTSVVDLTPVEVATDIEGARQAGYDFLWLQETDKEDNGVAIDPQKVVSLIRV